MRWMLPLFPLVFLLGCESTSEEAEAEPVESKADQDPLAPAGVGPPAKPDSKPRARARKPQATKPPTPKPLAPKTPPRAPDAWPAPERPSGPGTRPPQPEPPRSRPAPSPPRLRPTAPPSRPGSGPLVSLAVKDLEVHAAIDMLAAASGATVELSPWVRGRVTIQLNDVPWRYALVQMLMQLGEFEVLGNGDWVRVVPRQLRFEGTVAATTPNALTIDRAGGKRMVLQLPHDAIRRAAILKTLQAAGPGDHVVCGAEFLQGKHVLSSVVVRRQKRRRSVH